MELARELDDRRHELGVEIVGFADSNVERIGRTVLGRVVGAVEDIPAMIRSFGADRIVVSLSDARGKLPMDQLLDIRLQANVTFDHLASAYEEYTGKIARRNASSQLVRVLVRVSQDSPAVAGKTRARCRRSRSSDSSSPRPSCWSAAALVKLTSPGGAIYRQDRVGLNGRVFTIYKLRTMRADAEAGTGPIWSRGERRAHHPSRTVPAKDPSRRVAAAVERACAAT